MFYLAGPKEDLCLLFIKLLGPIQLFLLCRRWFRLCPTDFLFKTLEISGRQGFSNITMFYLAEPKQGLCLLFLKLLGPIQLLLLGRGGFCLCSTDFLLKTLKRQVWQRFKHTPCYVWQDLRSDFCLNNLT